MYNALVLDLKVLMRRPTHIRIKRYVADGEGAVLTAFALRYELLCQIKVAARVVEIRKGKCTRSLVKSTIEGTINVNDTCFALNKRRGITDWLAHRSATTKLVTRKSNNIGRKISAGG